MNYAYYKNLDALRDDFKDGGRRHHGETTYLEKALKSMNGTALSIDKIVLA